MRGYPVLPATLALTPLFIASFVLSGQGLGLRAVLTGLFFAACIAFAQRYRPTKRWSRGAQARSRVQRPLDSPAVLGEIDHIGIVVEDLDASIALYRDRFGMREQHRETVEEFGVEAALLEIGDAHIELLMPASADSAVARFLERSGPGMHHVAYRTDDIDGVLERMREQGVRLIDEEPRTGIRDSRVAFVHPKSTGGVLTELVQPADHAAEDAHG